jgi:hypothetical protein
MNYYGWMVFFHVASASAFVMTMIIMQLVVANVMKRIPDGPGKKDGIHFIQNRWHPVVDTIIIIVGITGLGIVLLNFQMVVRLPFLILKITIGMISLTAAYCNHFYFRRKKNKLTISGEHPDQLFKIVKIMPILDKVALIGGALAAFMGWHLNHV